MPIIDTEPVHGPPKQGLVFMIVVMCAGVLALLLTTACGSVTQAKPAAATLPACKGMEAWAKAGGTGALGELIAGMKAITKDMRAGDPATLQSDGIAMSQITQLAVVSNAPPVAVAPWVDMVLDLNKAGQALTGGDVETAGPLVSTASNLSVRVSKAVGKCGV